MVYTIFWAHIPSKKNVTLVPKLVSYWLIQNISIGAKLFRNPLNKVNTFYCHLSDVQFFPCHNHSPYPTNVLTNEAAATTITSSTTFHLWELEDIVKTLSLVAKGTLSKHYHDGCLNHFFTIQDFITHPESFTRNSLDGRSSQQWSMIWSNLCDGVS